MYDLIVVGGGPAGVTAAVYAWRWRLNVALVSRDVGGQTKFHLSLPANATQSLVRGIDIFRDFQNEMEQVGLEPTLASVDRVCRQQDRFAVHTDIGDVLVGDAVIIATGVQYQPLNVPGEEQYMMRGIGYSARSFGPRVEGKTAVVIGDGKLALRAAAYLSTLAKHVHLVGFVGDGLGLPLGKRLASADNVTILDGYVVTQVSGDEYARSVTVQSPEGQVSQVEADAFFVEKGVIPNSQMVAALVDLEPQGHINVDARNRTNVPGILAAGDVANTHIEQVVVAIGDGAKAALSAYEYLLPTL